MPLCRTWLGIAVGLIALSACSRGDSEGDGANTTVADTLSGKPSSARDYIAQFITDDPDA